MTMTRDLTTVAMGIDTKPNIINGTKISYNKPPVWDSACAAFRIDGRTAVFTYGDTIYNPNMFPLSDHIIEHEKTHMEQQGHSTENAALWWGKYMRDKEFMIDQEAEAYGRQYNFVAKQYDRKTRRHFLKQLAKVFSGHLYNYALSYDQAVELIKQYAGTEA